MRTISHKLSQGELDNIAQYWLVASETAAGGDSEMQAFVHGTFGPWATEIMRVRRD